MDAVNVGKEAYLHLCEFPDDLTEEILPWFPAEYLFRFRTVCKQWNTILSSTRFITTQWAEAPPNKNPWLVVGAVEYNGDCWAYSSFTRSWKRSCLSLSFLEGQERRSPNSSLVSPSFSYLGSSAGLFLIQGNFTKSIYVCNPFTAQYSILPPTVTYMDHFLTDEGEIGIVQEGEDGGYKVLVVHDPDRYEEKIVEIYDSTNESWRMAGVLSGNLHLLQSGTVFSGDYFYCLMEEDPFITGILGFNMLDGTSFFVPVPVLLDDYDDEDRYDVYFTQLVGCRSRILYVVGVKMEPEIQSELEEEEEVIIWEFNKDADTNWEEIATMPPALYPFRPTWRSFECAGIGDCLYLKKEGVKEVAVYNLTQNSWALLPSCPIAGVADHRRVSAFKPMPEMRVV